MHWKTFAAIILLILSRPVGADVLQPIEIKMSALEFTGVVQQNLNGAFDLFIKDVEKNTNVRHDYQVLSPARAAKKFFQHENQCLIPSSLTPQYFEGFDVIHSKSFAIVRYLAFTRPSQETIKNKDQLAGKVIGVIRDSDTWNYEKRFNLSNVDYVKVSDLATLVELLYKKRVDVAIHDHVDFIAMTEHLAQDPPNYHYQAPMAIDKVVITCHNSEITRAYMKRVNLAIEQAIKNDDFKNYYQLSTINED
ncbi:hypothetical protein [Thalassotalea sp. PLHSN55]|uniref:hypothetical protein n=1 Tax=Thalassotalea sp. PLHSN55 TaxID=3435888 RepID=UPI003F859CD8